MTRACKECPSSTRTVCKHAFGVYWCIKSQDGEGCNSPMDATADAWLASGWRKTSPKPAPAAPSNTPPKQKPNKQSEIDFSPLSDDDY